MKDHTLTGWQDYWKVFDELIEQLNADKKTDIISEFKEVQKYVNGLTDGWYEFKFSFEKVLKSNRQNMTKEQNEIAEFFVHDTKQNVDEQMTRKTPYNIGLAIWRLKC